MAPSDSDLSSLSSAPPTDDEAAMAVDEISVGIAKYFKKESETPPPKREPSPPHDYVLADNSHIAFIVMFRARFHEAFPRSCPHFGPQDIERGVEDPIPGEYVERLLCALLGLVLNRKKDVERNHYTRPLEEAISTHQSQWPKTWEGKNPLHGGRSFAAMSPEERLDLLRSLILWSLSSSEAIQAKIKESYKQARHDDDLNQPLSVQPWGRDSLKRRYWLIEGQDDTHFRLYRESNPALKNVSWWSVAGSIPEIQSIAEKLQQEKGTNSKKLSERIMAAVPRFEASEEKRKRRDYRLARKAAFSRPEPGFSMYEGRTRGKKLKYTYSDDEDIFSDDQPSRRSGRNASSNAAFAEPRTRFTASGRQIRSRAGGLYGEALLSGQREDSDDDEEEDNSRPQRSRTSTNPNGYSGYAVDDFDDESEARFSGHESGHEWGSAGDENEFEGDDEGENASGDESIINGEPPSLVVQLRYGKGSAPNEPKPPVDEPPPVQDVQMKDSSNPAPSTDPQAPPLQSSPFSIQAMLNSTTETSQQGQTLPVGPPPSVPSATAPEEPKSVEPAESNGLSGHTAVTESHPAPGVSTSQAPSTQSLNPAS